MADGDAGGAEHAPPRALPGTLLLAQDCGWSPTGRRRYSLGGETVDLPAPALPDVVVGEASTVAAARVRHRALFDWCRRQGLQPPAELGPEA